MTHPLPQALHELSQDPRITIRRPGVPPRQGKCVVYWMERAQRIADNHALDVAIHAANELGLPVIVYFAATAEFLPATARHLQFLQQGLRDVEQDAAARNVTFIVRIEDAEPWRFAAEVHAALVIGDENPLRKPESCREKAAAHLEVPFWTVDADVVVPSRLLEKAQYGAYTLRPRVQRLWPQFLKDHDNPRAAYAWKRPKNFPSHDLRAELANLISVDRTVAPVDAWTGGSQAGRQRLKKFVTVMLESYDSDRNRPELDGSSRMSPYLRFGHVGPLTIALAVEDAVKSRPHLQAQRDSYFNELLVWRELAVNFCRYAKRYDSWKCAENWARTTIAEHAHDERPHRYSLSQMERAATHDDLWNAAQRQMVDSGWMHNVMRMYWGKKILEWSPSIDTAFQRAVYLNDKYELDGTDPNGYAGIAWAIVGKFDRAWGERPIFGKIRYMSAQSTGKKFDSQKYMRQTAR